MKEKQDNEDKSNGGNQAQTSPLLSPQQPSCIRSPPPIVEETTLTEEGPIGAGLPLLQRILLLKAREEKTTKAAKTGVGGSTNRPHLSSIKGELCFSTKSLKLIFAKF